MDSPTRAGMATGRLAWLCVAAWLVAAGPARADRLPVGNVTEIKIEGNDTVLEQKILAKLKSRVGRPFDKRLVEEDKQALIKAEWFTDVQTYYKPDPKGGVILYYTVQEMPILRSVEYRGMRALKLNDVEQNTRMKKGKRADHVKASMAVDSLTRMYREKGYDMAVVRLVEGGKPNDTKVVFEIFEGPKCRVVAVDFEGNKFVESGVLATKIQSGPRLLGLFPKKFTPEDLEDDRKKLIEYYDGQGFLKVNVTYVTRALPNQGDVKVTFVIWEDVQFKVRSIRFEGNEKIDTKKLMDGMKLHSGQAYNLTLKDVDEKLIKSKYGGIGCIDAAIRVERELTDQPGVLDLAYVIEEGNPYYIGALVMKGNIRTQDRVIRREANMAGLVPGQPLDQNRLDTYKARLGRLKYFVVTPDRGKMLDVRLDNKRSEAQLYANSGLPSGELFDTARARLQSGGAEDSPPPRQVARQVPDATPAPGDGPANVAPIVEPPADFALPPIVAPAPEPTPGGQPGAGDAPGRTPPLGNREPPGTFPSLTGSNTTDVGPDRQEPFANRSFADIVTSLDEAPTGNLMFGVGASSYGGLFANFIVHEGNFDYKALPKSVNDLFSGNAFRGAGQDLRIELSPGTAINRAQISFRNPYLFDLPIGFNISAYTTKRIYTDWTEQRTGVRTGLGKQFGLRTYADVAVRAEDVSLFGYRTPAPADLLAASGHTDLFSIRPSLRFDNRNDPFASTAGQYLDFAFEQYWGSFQAPKLTVEGRQYVTLGSRPDGTGKRFVTFRGFFGVTGRDTPIYERFFAGDFRSMRGFSYRGVGPRELDVNVGGVMTALGSVEYQFPWLANDKLQQVVFCDFGTVESSYDFTKIRASVGTGLRVYLPQQMFGPLPLAFDLAFPISRAHEDHTQYFTFFIGAFW